MVIALIGAAAQLQAAAGQQACTVPRSRPSAEGLSPARVQEFVDSARATGSDAIVIPKNGKLVAEWYSDSGRTPAQTMSATKSIAGLAVGRIMAGLSIGAIDFAKFGQLMLNGGTWNGERLLPESWIAQSVTASQTSEPRYGLMWWVEPESTPSTIDSALLRTWNDAHAPEEIIRALAPLSGKRFGLEWRGEWVKALASAGGMPRFMALARDAGVPVRRIIVGPSRGYSANGSPGQWLLVLPDGKLVIARQLKRRPGLTERNFFADMPALAMRLLAQK